MDKKIMLLGAGELGKEFAIAAKRLGLYVIAVDRYENAPAMQVCDEFAVIDMLDGAALDRVVAQHQPDIIVPEIEAIRTEKLAEFEKRGVQVVPTAKATHLTMNRDEIRNAAREVMGLVQYRAGKLDDAMKSFQAIITDPLASRDAQNRVQIYILQLQAEGAKLPPPPVNTAASSAPPVASSAPDAGVSSASSETSAAVDASTQLDVTPPVVVDTSALSLALPQESAASSEAAPTSASESQAASSAPAASSEASPASAVSSVASSAPVASSSAP